MERVEGGEDMGRGEKERLVDLKVGPGRVG